MLEVVTDISDKMKIKTQEQIRNLTNHQKVEVVFIRLVFEGILFNIGEVVYGEIIAFLKVWNCFCLILLLRAILSYLKK